VRTDTCALCSLLSRRYSARLLLYILVVLLLSCLDAFFTLYLLYLGAAETNPVMAFFLSFGPGVFMIAKYGITVFCVLIMLFGAIHMGQERNRMVGLLFSFLVCAFGIAITWEVYLLFFALE